MPGHVAAHQRHGLRPATRPRGGWSVLTTRRRLVLWRHGRTTWNIEERFQGRADVPLDEAGHAQAERAARLLTALRPDVIVSSDLRRAADTAESLARLTGRPVWYDKDLRERDMGRWEGLTIGEVRSRWPGEWQARQPTDGETLADVADRVEDALRRALEDAQAATTLVVVAHGSSLRLGMVRLLGFPEELWGRVGALANCCWSVLGEDGLGWRLVEHNAGTLPELPRGDDR